MDLKMERRNDEIAGYIKGVVDLERELYKKIEEENKPKNGARIMP